MDATPKLFTKTSHSLTHTLLGAAAMQDTAHPIGSNLGWSLAQTHKDGLVEEQDLNLNPIGWTTHSTYWATVPPSWSLEVGGRNFG